VKCGCPPGPFARAIFFCAPREHGAIVVVRGHALHMYDRSCAQLHSAASAAKRPYGSIDGQQDIAGARAVAVGQATGFIRLRGAIEEGIVGW
jgi:hypothetical protein